MFHFITTKYALKNGLKKFKEQVNSAPNYTSWKFLFWCMLPNWRRNNKVIWKLITAQQSRCGPMSWLSHCKVRRLESSKRSWWTIQTNTRTKKIFIKLWTKLQECPSCLPIYSTTSAVMVIRHKASIIPVVREATRASSQILNGFTAGVCWRISKIGSSACNRNNTSVI